VQVKEKAPYFVLEKIILHISLRVFKAFDCKYEFRICKFYHVWKIKKFRVFPSGRARGSIHPGQNTEHFPYRKTLTNVVLVSSNKIESDSPVFVCIK